MTGEEIGVAADRLRALDGVRDLAISALIGKKGRPLHGFRLLVAPDALDAVKERCLSETSTIGLRWHFEERDLLERRGESVRDGETAVRVKQVRRPGRVTVKVESDDLASLDSLTERRAVKERLEGRRNDRLARSASARRARHLSRADHRGVRRRRQHDAGASGASLGAGWRRACSMRCRPPCPVRRRIACSATPTRMAGSSSIGGSGEFEDGRYRANPVDRCYFCKTNLYDRIRALTDGIIASGANTDDLGDYRPGLKAAAERGIVHPFVEAAISKAEVRALARHHGLDDLAELPAQPCLASRIETGIAISADDLAFVNEVETALAPLLPRQAALRCRVTREGIVIEADADHAATPMLKMQAMVLCAEAGRLFAGVRAYERGSAFIGKPAVHHA